MENNVHEIEQYLLVLGPNCRRGDYGEAARILNQFLALLQNPSVQKVLSQISPGLIKKFNYSLETIFIMFKNQDWVAVADIIEYELIGLWKEIIGASELGN
jgi:hypothetical protein